MGGKRANGKLRVLSGKILRRILNPGLINILKKRPLSFTAVDPTRRPVPGWHGSSCRRVSKRFSPSKGAGQNGIRRISPLNRNENIKPEVEEKADGNDEKRFSPF
jgi:hypothetical protein